MKKKVNGFTVAEETPEDNSCAELDEDDDEYLSQDSNSGDDDCSSGNQSEDELEGSEAEVNSDADSGDSESKFYCLSFCVIDIY